MAFHHKVINVVAGHLNRLTGRVAVQNPTYAQDGLYTEHCAEFMASERFMNAYAAGEATGSWNGAPVHWRVYIACWLAEQSSRLNGDLIECGVNRGGIARAIVSYLDSNLKEKRFYLLDTYKGLPVTLLSERESKHLPTFETHYSDSFAAVSSTFGSFPNVVIVPGVVPYSFKEIKSEGFCFVHIDMNNARSEIAAAEFLWPKLTAGGFMLLDDYGWQINIDQRTAFNRFAQERSVSVLALPTGQGLLMKA